MGERVVLAPNGVYRTPGRTAPAPRIPRPSWRTLLAPLGHGVFSVLLVVAAIAIFNAITPVLFEPSNDVRLIPAVDQLETVLSFGLLATLALVVFRIARRVRPSWGGLGIQTKVAYVLALLFVQSAVVVAAEVAIFFDRGGLHLFGPSHLSSTWLADGRTAHVYTPNGLRCGYDVFISGPLALTARRSFELSRSSCLEPPPRVRLHPDGSVDLVDAANKRLESQPSPSFSFGLGGC